jgi:pyridoxamine 5'-phosphate oxidase
MDIAALRKEYTRASLDEGSADRDPYALFARWFDEAVKGALPEPHAMTLATVEHATHGFARPATRVVLMKGFDARGFVFYTNYRSAKGRELAANPFASLHFFWPELERQVRIDGPVEQVDAADSDAYYRSRPLGSRHGAWASPQSEPIENREWLERRLAEVVERHGDDPPRPPHWGGYRVKPELFEFWQGRPSRLHDRLRYRRGADGWNIGRLAP